MTVSDGVDQSVAQGGGGGGAGSAPLNPPLRVARKVNHHRIIKKSY